MGVGWGLGWGLVGQFSLYCKGQNRWVWGVGMGIEVMLG